MTYEQAIAMAQTAMQYLERNEWRVFESGVIEAAARAASLQINKEAAVSAAIEQFNRHEIIAWDGIPYG